MKTKEGKKPIFFFHYNKPASQRAGKPQISVHWRKTCYILDNVVINVPCHGKIRNRQPYFVMVGRGNLVVNEGIGMLH